jgi:hypothetical protein
LVWGGAQEVSVRIQRKKACFVKESLKFTQAPYEDTHTGWMCSGHAVNEKLHLFPVEPLKVENTGALKEEKKLEYVR